MVQPGKKPTEGPAAAGAAAASRRRTRRRGPRRRAACRRRPQRHGRRRCSEILWYLATDEMENSNTKRDIKGIVESMRRKASEGRGMMKGEPRSKNPSGGRKEEHEGESEGITGKAVPSSPRNRAVDAPPHRTPSLAPSAHRRPPLSASIRIGSGGWGGGD